MYLATITLNQIIIMFVLMLVGYLCFKFNIITEEGNKLLSNLLLTLVIPIMIFSSYQRELTKELLNGLLISFALAVITHIVGIIISFVVLKGKNKDHVAIERFSVIFSNCGFMGFPLVDAIYGSEGVFYLTAYVTIFNILVWTLGVFMMSDNQNIKSIWKLVISPTTVTIAFGILFFVIQIRLPGNVLKAMDYISTMNTPMAMLVAGGTIATANLRTVFGKVKIYAVTFLKLLLVPGIILLLYTRLPISEPVMTTAILAVACPTASTGTLFALRYNKDATYASEIFVISTLLSIVSIPCIMTLMGLLMK